MRIVLLLLIFIFFVGCIKMPEPTLSKAGQPARDERRFCASDIDCAAEQCCHPTGAVNKRFMPACADAVCTMECAPRTLDCNQGEVRCLNSQCMVFITHPL